MTKAGIGPEAILAFIESAGTFNLEADQIIYLHDLGLPSGLVTAMLQHDTDLSSGVLPLPVTAVPKLPPPVKSIAGQSTNTMPVAATARPSKSSPAATGLPAPPEVAIEDDLYANYPELFDEYQPPAPHEPAGFSPVRLPYAVPLTDPIIMVRAADRMPNVISIRMP